MKLTNTATDIVLPFFAFCLIATCALFACRGKEDREEFIKTKWQYDDVRTRLKNYEDQSKRAEEFYRTNTDRRFGFAVDVPIIQWTPRKGDIELGYRSDGIVVWRDLPEASK